ncbi:MAG: four helix bundle protein [Patescibacteria group bacterium]|nr:four helix bundle protein [Patescibacteria group bacterium]
MSNDQISSNSLKTKPSFDLEERTAKFSEEIIDFCKKLPRNPITIPLISQLTRAATSIGANYCEADEASSKKDFINKACIAKKEAKETKYWLRIVAHTDDESKVGARKLWQEANELNLILAAIIRNTKNKIEN